jgi:hypothetical protein
MPDAWLLDGGGSARRLDQRALEQCSAADGQLWIHLDHQTDGARSWLLTRSGNSSPTQAYT